MRYFRFIISAINAMFVTFHRLRLLGYIARYWLQVNIVGYHAIINTTRHINFHAIPYRHIIYIINNGYCHCFHLLLLAFLHYYCQCLSLLYRRLRWFRRLYNTHEILSLISLFIY